MKSIILLATILFSSQNFAEVLSKSKSSDVVSAIKESINNNNYECKDKTKYSSGYLITWKDLFPGIVTIDENNQSVINITNLDLYNSTETILNTITSVDLTVVEKLSFKINQLKSITVNRGTITNPQFVKEIQRTIAYDFECTISPLEK